MIVVSIVVFFSSRRRHTRYWRDWSSDVCSSDLVVTDANTGRGGTYTRAPAVYTAPAILPRRSHKRIVLEAELRSPSQKIQARLVEGEAVINEQDVQLGRVAAGDLLCGVLSRSGPAFDFLPSLDLPPPLRRARLAHLEVTDLPTRPQLPASLR